MKKQLLLIAALLTTLTVAAADLTGKRIYINPGHGSFGPNDRPMATIPFPNLPATKMPDTCGFYETNTNLWKCLELGKRLREAGATVDFSRTANGPWPYVYPYEDYNWNDYQNLPDYTMYNRNLSEISAEVEAGNYDFFISVHSNAAADGTSTNFPLLEFAGEDNQTYMRGDSYRRAEVVWPYLFECMASGLDPYSAYSPTKPNIRGDISFNGDEDWPTKNTASGITYHGYLGVLKHGCPGFLSEGYFHTYQPARHRALNPDYCRQEGIRYFRGIMAYYEADPDTKGYIMGTVKDLHEKIVNSLFQYTPKTNDQWLPCNGAVVTLYKAGVKIADYTVDNFYNGIFYFPDLEPGNDYTLEATCEGYKPLFDEYKTPITVEANKTTYPMIYLESESYEPPKVVYTDYPDQAATAAVEMPTAIKMENKETYSVEGIEGTIKRTIFVGDSIIMLSHSEDGTPHLYLLNMDNKTLTGISLNGITPCDAENKGDFLSLSDVALTCDGKLLGCNFIENQYSDAQVNDDPDHTGYKRGVLRIYKWDDLSAEPVEWVTSLTSANLYNAEMGHTMVVYGSSEDCSIIVSAASFWGTKSLWMSILNVVENKLISDNFRCTASLKVLGETGVGENYMFQLSPRGEKRNFIVDAERITPMELAPTTTANHPDTLGILPVEALGLPLVSSSYFVYAGKAIMVAPYTNEANQVAGVRMFDITEGLSEAKQIAADMDLETPVDAAFASAGAMVEGTDFTVRLCIDGNVTTFTTKGVEQPVVAHVYAYGLQLEQSDNAYTFRFHTNAEVLSAEIVFYEEGEEVGSLPAEMAEKEGSATIASENLPLTEGVPGTWAVRVYGNAVGSWGRLHSQKVSELGITRGFCSVDNSPESDYFGRIYILDRAGASDENSGLHAFNQDYTRINTSVLKGGRSMYGSPYRSYVDDQGYIWLSDGSDGYSGIIIANPADLEGTYEEFFGGATRNSAGVLSYNGIEVGSSCLGLSVYGSGADTKLIAYNEDPGSVLPSLGLAIYDIGTETGTYLHEWTTAPSATMQLTGQLAYDGYPLGCSHGIWVATRRSAGNNNNSATALKFYDWAGKELLSSASDEYKEIIDGCSSGAYALTPDEKQLIMIDGSSNLLLFDIVWEEDKPIMTLRYAYPCGISDIREMHFDYAGNLVTSGTEYFTVFTVPTDNNTTVTPAKKSLTITNSGPINSVSQLPLEGIWYSQGIIYNTGNVAMQVYSASGQLVASGNSDINMSAMPQGVYVVRTAQGTLKLVR